ncbi:hypothetical protein EV361DRAFT_225270 [Lentinula raphanica]|nr:hypothetical protein EV361DRAFT_225270 [Lentinula raphanica]
MADSPLVKRLHISGLAPSLTPADLSARLSHFGTVKSVDGFGLSDGVGQPRKFGYVTIETTSGMLKKCLSSLSGTTYKGAKLRIGEAKPDFAERIAKEKAESSSESSNEQRRLHHSKFSGVQASDMSLVTRDNAAERPGWKVMPSGRVVRTMKMRPGKPLPPLPTHLMDQSHSKVKKKKVKEPDARARSRLIDVTKWDGSYVSGVFLGGDQVAQVVDGRVGAMQAKKKEQEEKKEKSKGTVKERKTKSETILIDKEENVPAPPRPSTPQSIPTPTVGAPLPTSSSSSKLPDLSAERAQTLSFLNTFLFSSSKTQSANPIDWDSDVDLDEVNVLEAPNAVGANDADGGYEIVPGEAEHEDQIIVDEDQGHGDSVDGADEDDVAHVSQDVDMRDENTTEAQPPPHKNKNTLQDLFAPREDEGGFSLLNHLDLEDDDDLDLDVVPFPTSAPVVETHQEDVSVHDTNSNQPPTLRSQQNRSSQPITLDPKKPLFFPRSIALATSGAASSPFYAHLTPEEIQRQWEENKVELTRGWKKRHREAGKVRRRRGVGVGVED